MPLVDPAGTTVEVDPDGYVRIDGLKVCRLVIGADNAWLEFHDRSPYRAQERAQRHGASRGQCRRVMVPLRTFQSVVALAVTEER